MELFNILSKIRKKVHEEDIMKKWYLSYDGNQTGPMDINEAAKQARINPSGHAWSEGMAEWLPISKVNELTNPNPLNDETLAPPPLEGIYKKGSGGTSHIVDYKINGAEMQFVEIQLDPGESIVAEAGSMMYKDSSIHMESIFGDGSAKDDEGGLFGKVLGAGKRMISGESLFTTLFTNEGSNITHVAFAAPYPGNIIPISLPDVGGTLICQKDAFLCAAKGVEIGIHIKKKILTALFGGEGFIMQKLEGDGMVFLHAGGTIIKKEIKRGEVLHVDTGCLVCMDSTVDFDLEKAGNIKTSIFGGEGLFFAKLSGEGTVWLQSLPFSRLAGRVLANARTGKGEGSVLGGFGGSLGSLIGGDSD